MRVNIFLCQHVNEGSLYYIFHSCILWHKSIKKKDQTHLSNNERGARWIQVIEQMNLGHGYVGVRCVIVFPLGYVYNLLCYKHKAVVMGQRRRADTVAEKWFCTHHVASTSREN